jgi:uncharacterized protein
MEQTTPMERYDGLRLEIKKYPSLLVAFSGGADSSLLAFAAKVALGHEHVFAVTASSPTFPERELEEAIAFCRRYGIPHRTITTDEVRTINDANNSPERCYFCKRELFLKLTALAAEAGFTAVAEGSNLDDDADFRPGRRAIAELGILSPLKAAGLSKAIIRKISKELGLPTWDKPAYACLTSRFPYHVEITSAALAMIEKAETFLLNHGFRQCRVRHYGEKARVEVEKEQMDDALRQKEMIAEYLQALGYREVEIDPQGYRTGSMNVFS